MNAQQQQAFHEMTLHWIRSRAWTIKRELNEKFDQAVIEMKLGTLRSKGYRNLGVDQYYECTKCGTDYPVMNGAIHCNGRSITKCLCQEVI